LPWCESKLYPQRRSEHKSPGGGGKTAHFPGPEWHPCHSLDRGPVEEVADLGIRSNRAAVC